MKSIYELEEYKQAEAVKNNIMIVDALNLAFRYKHTSKYADFSPDYQRTVHSLAKSYASGKIIITADYGKSSYRKEIYPEYKGDREDKIANQTEEENQQFQDFIEEFNNVLEELSVDYPVLKFKGVEADDIAAYLSHYYFKDYNGHIWLISSDKDWDLLINKNVSRFSFVTRKEYKLDNWDTYYDFPHEHTLDIKVLQGGKDNVKGIPGIGPKRAAGLIEQYGSAFDLYDSIPIPGKAKYIQSLNENKERIMLNYSLIDKITHCREAIGKDNLEAIDNMLGVYA